MARGIAKNSKEAILGYSWLVVCPLQLRRLPRLLQRLLRLCWLLLLMLLLMMIRNRNAVADVVNDAGSCVHGSTNVIIRRGPWPPNLPSFKPTKPPKKSRTISDYPLPPLGPGGMQLGPRMIVAPLIGPTKPAHIRMAHALHMKFGVYMPKVIPI